MGTLSEYTIAFEENKPIGVLANSGGIANHLKDITAFCNKHRDEPVFFCNDLESLFRMVISHIKKDQWQELAEDYQNISETTDKAGYDEAISAVNAEDAVILDYGCGNGKFSRRLEKLNPSKIFAVDISQKAISLARKVPSSKIHYRCIKNSLDFIGDNSLDFVFLNFVLCCISKIKDIGEIMNEIHRKLRKNGTLIILDPHPDALGKRFGGVNPKPGMPVRVKLDGMKKEFYDYWRPVSAYKKMLKKFKIEKIKRVSPKHIIIKSKKK
jgi:SAM-dependent methyltransferase